MYLLVFIAIIILLGSAFFSGVEASLFSVSLSRAKFLATKGKRGAKSFLKIKENIRRPITVIVIFNNVFNIVGSILVGVVATKLLENSWLGLASGVLTFLIIVFGEIVPKSIGENHAEPICLFISRPLLLSTKIFFPFVWIIEKMTKPFTKKNQIISEEEIRILSHLGHLEGAIEEDEEEMIQRVFKLNDLTAKDIMTPRTVVDALDGNRSILELQKTIQSSVHSRLPVFSGNLDNIIGICHQRDLLIALSNMEKEKKITEFKQDVIFVSEKIKADKLLTLFQERKAHLAIVKDEFGGTTGIITLEDVLEELVGEIVDETDKEVDMRAKARRLKNAG
ncbi:MAG: hemolysin family protein [Candidatus Marinimicrobia bacterium]|nr:hemolysin family protein [Candidatus Neomarinimicrobiota bacterium]